MSDIRKNVSEYYAKVTTEKEGVMETGICACAIGSTPKEILGIIEEISEEIKVKFYGCGSPIPPALEGCTVLDLGCGTGRDCYIASKLVGENGKVIGIDMTEKQLEIAQKYQDEMAKKFGYKKSNVEFKHGFIEDLKSIGIEDNSVDVVISNCVINLSPNKKEVFEEIWRILKPGGELYFSDIFCDRRLKEEISNDPILRGECLGGAMYIEDFRRMMQSIGWKDFRYVSTTNANIGNEKIESLVGNAKFTSRTVRAFKLPQFLEDICEEYGQFATYKGGIPLNEFSFKLDDHHTFMKNLPMSVCGNTCAMVENTRFNKYFNIVGNRSEHFGPFKGCGTAPNNEEEKPSACSSGCC